jgi:hypothetical protein
MSQQRIRVILKQSLSHVPEQKVRLFQNIRLSRMTGAKSAKECLTNA